MTDDKTRQLENRIDKLESTIEKMMPSRRDALKMGGAALVGGAAMSGTASAGTNQVGTIGSQASPVDLESEDINNSDTITTQDIVVNGTATGSFGGGVPADFTYDDVKSSRSLNTDFTNTTGSALFVMVTSESRDSGDFQTEAIVDGDIIQDEDMKIDTVNSFANTTVSFFVPDGSNYKVRIQSPASFLLRSWFEAEM